MYSALCYVWENVVRRDPDLMAWYPGPTLLACLESLPACEHERTAPFRLPVQFVIRTDGSFRGYGGSIAAGMVEVGDPVRVVPSGRRSTVTGILIGERSTFRAGVGESVTVVLLTKRWGQLPLRKIRGKPFFFFVTDEAMDIFPRLREIPRDMCIGV